jgi:AhpD family alkylhydroperoxidase
MTITDTTAPRPATTTDAVVPVRSPRADVFGAWPAGYRKMKALSEAVRGSGLDPALLMLVNLRASQINGCHYCIDMHVEDALAAGESDQRLHLLPAWRDVALYTERERAALALTEAVTLVAGAPVSDEVVDEAARVFTPEELSQLTFAVAVINTWNRLIVTARSPLRGAARPD